MRKGLLAINGQGCPTLGDKLSPLSSCSGNYTQPKPRIGHLEAHNPLDLVCLDVTKIDPSKTGKENVLVITDAFTKFSIAVCTPNQTAKTVAKVLVEK